MSLLVLKAYLKLIHFDLYLARGNFAALYNKVRVYPIAKKSPTPDAVERICHAVDMACIWYWKEALCLQSQILQGHDKTISLQRNGRQAVHEFARPGHGLIG